VVLVPVSLIKLSILYVDKIAK